MKPIQIVGAGGHGRVVAEAAELQGYRVIEFFDQNWPKRKTNGKWQIVGQIPEASDVCFCAIGNNLIRSKHFLSLNLQASPVIAHPNATISNSATLGAGTFLAAGAIVNAGTTAGQGVILNTGCSVDHDCSLGDFAHISPGALLAGGVTVGARSWIGIGAVVIEGIQIGSDVVIGAGSVVLEDVEDGTKVAGIPARRL